MSINVNTVYKTTIKLQWSCDQKVLMYVQGSWDLKTCSY